MGISRAQNVSKGRGWTPPEARARGAVDTAGVAVCWLRLEHSSSRGLSRRRAGEVTNQ